MKNLKQTQGIFGTQLELRDKDFDFFFFFSKLSNSHDALFTLCTCIKRVVPEQTL